jgi:hypothetical protein
MVIDMTPSTNEPSDQNLSSPSDEDEESLGGTISEANTTHLYKETDPNERPAK